jgi:DNA polymerase-3 subunit epsilon
MSLPSHLVAFDTETTGVDVEQDRICSAFIGLFDVASDRFIEEHSWLIDPGVQVPEAATAVHGYSTEDLQFAGTDARMSVFEISQRLDVFDRRGVPLVVFNAPFDFTILDREYRRHYPGGRPFEPKTVIDPLVLDKARDQYRKGKRTLTSMCPVYRVPVEENAHDAGADCLMAARLAVALLRTPEYAGLTTQQIHVKTIPTYAKQMRGLAQHFAKTDPARARTIDLHWPIKPLNEGATA